MGIIIDFILGIFFKKDETSGEESLNWVFVLVAVVIALPILYYMYTGVSGIIHDVFNIKTKKEIIVEQKNTIKKLLGNNLDLHKTIKLQTKINKVDIKSIVKLNKDFRHAANLKYNIKQNLNTISKSKYIKLKKQVKEIKKTIPKKVSIKVIKEVNTTKSLIVNKEKYEVSGLNTFNNITNMYNSVVKDDK